MTTPLVDELRWMLRQSRAPKIRSLRQFAEQEVVLCTGPRKGRFRASTQPYMGLWLDAVDSGRYQRINTTGPRQGGKTVIGCNIPALYHLFEIAETIIFAVPDLDIADDKFRENLLPAIQATRYAELLPTSGEGSRSGRVKNAVVFKNGATIKFMTGGASGLASDRGRQGYTARVVIVTEKSAFGCGGDTSVEANKLEQIRACTRAFGDQARFYEESTVTTELDPTWTDLKQGTDSRILAPCPTCEQFVAPEREHLVGWQEAQSETEAREQAHFVCPACGAAISEQQRPDMNRRAILVHRGQNVAAAQEIGNGETTPLICGDHPPTTTLGFRFSAFHNLFVSAAQLAADEWKAAREANEDDAQRKMCQFVWCLPYQSNVTELATISVGGLTTRQAPTPKGLVPAGCQVLTVGCDIGKWKCWFIVIAWLADGSSVVIDYGSIDVNSEQLGEEAALYEVLTQLRTLCETGWAWEGHGEARPADFTAIDSAYQGALVFRFVRECQQAEATRDRYWPVRGFGEGQLAGHSYHQPKKTGNQTLLIGDGYHVTAFPAERVHVIEFDADQWKTRTHERLSCDAGSRGAMRLYSALPKLHQQIARHWTAEKQQIEFIPGKGEVAKWVVVRRGNHLLDCTSGASIIAHFGGVRVLPPEPETKSQKSEASPVSPAIVTPSGQPFSILER